MYNTRNSSMELLRIISMIMIVSCHFVAHGGFTFASQTLSISRFWCNFMLMGGNIGNNVFVLMSGYFLINDKGDIFDIKRILKFLGQVFFYSIAIYCIFGIAGISEFGDISLTKGTIFPITFGSWWFASTYFVLYIIHPFINIFLRNLDECKFQKLLIMLLTIWCVIPTFTASSYQSNNLLWFATLYSVASYVRLYGLKSDYVVKHWFLAWLLFLSLRYLSCIILMWLGTKISFAYNHTLFFYGLQSILTFLSALAFFMIFEKIEMGYHKWINIIASATFGVYLIHDSQIVRPFLWLHVFKNFSYQESIMIIPYSIYAITVTYVVCTMIDLLRKQVFEKPYMKIVNRYADLWLKPFERIYEYFKQMVFNN